MRTLEDFNDVHTSDLLLLERGFHRYELLRRGGPSFGFQPLAVGSEEACCAASMLIAGHVPAKVSIGTFLCAMMTDPADPDADHQGDDDA